MSNVLLINPPMKQEEIFGENVKDSASIIPPLGLAYIAGYLLKYDHTCRIIDGVVEKIGIRDIVELSDNYEVIFITITSAYYIRAVELINALSKVDSHPPIIVGGPHVTSIQHEILIEGADIAIIGEGEETAFELVSYFNSDDRQINSNGLHDIDGIAFLDPSGNLVKTNKRKLIDDLDSIPMPARHLLRMDQYSCSIARSVNYPSLSIMTSRGCTGSCTFCNHKTFGNGIRSHSPDRIVKEIIELIDTYGANDISFLDDNFLANREVVMKVCSKLQSIGFNKSFSVESRVDCIDYELLCELKKTGCTYINYGFESGSQRILDKIQKVKP